MSLRGVAGAIGVVLGLLTLVAGGRVILGVPAAVANAGDYVPFVLWFTFLAGFVYVAAGVGLGLGRRWGARLALRLAAATILVFAAFGVHVARGGAFETRTVVALTFRSALWCALAWVGYRTTGQPTRSSVDPGPATRR